MRNKAVVADSHVEVADMNIGNFVMRDGTCYTVRGIVANGLMEVVEYGTDKNAYFDDKDLEPIPLCEEFLKANGFASVDADVKYIKYERQDQWHRWALIYNKARKRYSYISVGSCVPLFTVDQFQRLLKLQSRYNKELLDTLTPIFNEDGEDNNKKESSADKERGV